MSKFGDLLGTAKKTFQIGDRTSGMLSLLFHNGFLGRLQTNHTAARTWTLPDTSGTILTDNKVSSVSVINSLQCNTSVLNFNTANPVVLLNALIATSYFCLKINVITAFNGSSPTLSIGTDVDNNKYVSSSSVNLTSVGAALFFQSSGSLTLAEDLKAYYVSGGSTTGKAEIEVFYVSKNFSEISSFNRNDRGYDIILGVMASNIVGYGQGVDLNYDFSHPRIFQLPNTGTYQGKTIQASEPLYHYEYNTGSIGSLLSFSKEYVQTIPENRKVLIVPAALANTGFSTNDWNPGNGLYNTTVSRVNSFLSSNPSSRLIAIITCPHGGDRGMSQSAYAVALDAFINGLRQEITGASNVPVLIGSFTDASLVAQPERQNAQNAINTCPSRLVNVVSVSGSGLASESDQVHYTAASQREMGSRYFLAYMSLR